MGEFLAIRAFLAGVRGRLRKVALGAVSLHVLAGAVALGLALPAIAGAVGERHALVLRGAGAAALVLLAITWLALALWRPHRRTASDAQVARWVGQQRPVLASDLLSAVELEREVGGSAGFSRELVMAFAQRTAGRLAGEHAHALVPVRGLRRGAASLALAGLAAAAVWLAWPATVRAGWERLARAGGAPVAEAVDEPLVADLALEVHYPAYMGRAPLLLPASSGDLTAPRGAEVRLSARLLRAARDGALVFDGEGAPPRVALTVAGGHASGSFMVDRAGVYRIELRGAGDARWIEAEPRRIDVELDHPPRVELTAPADELDVSTQKRIELGYEVEDDIGLGEIALVWQPEGGKPERKLLPKATGKTAGGRFMWDLAEVAMPPGARVTYFVEARDNDVLHGPNVGRSRSYTLRAYSPRERHAAVVAQLRETLELTLGLLGQRLPIEGGPTWEHRRLLAQKTDQLAAGLAQLVAMLSDDTLAPKGLAEDLVGMQKRLGKLARDEVASVDRFERGPRTSPAERAATAAWEDVHDKAILELERDALALDDWLGRASVESMLAITDELAARQARLADLLKQQTENPSEDLRAAIDRELKAIADLERELAMAQQQMPSDVADRFVNMDALRDQADEDCMKEVRALFDKGDVAGAQARLAECEKKQRDAQDGLEQSLRELRGEKFSEEEQAFGELMNEIGDLENEEHRLAAEAGEIEERARRAAAEAVRDQASPGMDKAKKTLERLESALATVPREGLTPFGQDELDALRRRAADVRHMLQEGDLAEALEMARQAEESAGALLGDLDDDMADGEPWSDQTDEALERMQKAEPLVDQLIADLTAAMPKPEDVMSAEDRAKLGALAKRQAALRERAKKTAQKAQQRGKQLPGGAAETARKGLESVGGKMQGAERRFGKLDPRGGRAEAERAADELAELRKSTQRSARPTAVESGRPDDEPVRIPGADEYKPPADFRERLLEGKQQGRAPESYRDQVESYYRELGR